MTKIIHILLRLNWNDNRWLIGAFDDTIRNAAEVKMRFTAPAGDYHDIYFLFFYFFEDFFSRLADTDMTNIEWASI